jgi:hypothetical protein
MTGVVENRADSRPATGPSSAIRSVIGRKVSPAARVE